MANSLFLSQNELRELTGFAFKAKQIQQLRRMGIAFFLNGAGRPIVTISTIEGRKQETAATPVWQPAVLTSGRRSA